MADKPWNWCQHCEQIVDADDIHDGSVVRCWGCRREFICVCGNDKDGTESWLLEEVEDEDAGNEVLP